MPVSWGWLTTLIEVRIFTMRTFAMIAVTILNIGVAIRYITLIRSGKIRPALAMWVFFTTAVILSLTTYMASGDYRLVDNILTTTDLFLVLTVTTSILLFGDASTRFNRFDLCCIGVVGMILIFWLLTKDHFTANLLVQLIQVVAYVPTVRRLWRNRVNTESFGLWSTMLLASALSIISNEGLLANIYSLRAIVSISLLMLLMVRAQLLESGKSLRRRRAA